MKKVITLFLSLIIVLTCICCSSKPNSVEDDAILTEPEMTTEPVPTKQIDVSIEPEATTDDTESSSMTLPLDLTGLWIQENRDESSYMVATVRNDGKIGVFFILEGDEEPWTYWVGTYDSPTSSDEVYSWISNNTYDGNGLFASSDETKEFTYDNGKLSYPITIQGESGFITLIRGDWDESKVDDSIFTAEKASKLEFKDIEIIDSGWYLYSKEWLYCYVVLHNPNENLAVEFPSVRVTARDESGVLLGTEDLVLSIIYPEQDFVYGTQAFSVDEIPSTVEFEMLTPDDYNITNINKLDDFKPLEVINVGTRSDKIVGEVKNPNDYNIDSAIVVAVCKDSNKNVVGIEFDFINDVKADSTTPFSINIKLDKSTDTIECYANQW